MNTEDVKQLEKELDDLLHDQTTKTNTVKKTAINTKAVLSEKKKPETKTKHHYEGHRGRVRSKIQAGGLEFFEDYELLEFMLFGAYARMDTKPIAKELLVRFGSLKDVLDATREELTAAGFSDSVVSLLAGYREVTRRYMMQVSTRGCFLNSSEKVKEYIHALCFGKKVECVYCIFLDDKKKIIKTEKIAEGSRNTVMVYTEELFRKISVLRAKYIIIGHNHPSGILKPSANDLNLLEEINKGAMAIRTYIYDAVIACDTGALSLSEAGYLKGNRIIRTENKTEDTVG